MQNLIIGEKLRKLRIKANYSQAFIAECLNISRNAYIDWENGKIDFTITKLQKISEFYQIELSCLISTTRQ